MKYEFVWLPFICWTLDSCLETILEHFDLSLKMVRIFTNLRRRTHHEISSILIFSVSATLRSTDYDNDLELDPSYNSVLLITISYKILKKCLF